MVSYKMKNGNEDVLIKHEAKVFDLYIKLITCINFIYSQSIKQ